MAARAWTIVVIVGLLLPAAASAQRPEPFTPEVGQAGKDVVWVPTPDPLVEKMLDLAKVGRDDFVIDLGSGDGRNVIGAARRGARALGVEYNPDMVELSRRKAAEAGVGGRAKFERGDMFQADISRATVMALVLLPSNLLQLRPKFVALAPGARIVSNTFLIADWPPDASVSIDDACEMWCEAHLWIVPAQVGPLAPAGGELRSPNVSELTGT
jgi:SAM-dependent methyltransferase